jgi:hypothetical protein
MVKMTQERREKQEELKMEMVKARFADIDDDDLIEGQTFFDELDTGKYDNES